MNNRMFSSRVKNKPQPAYDIPRTKLKNVCCVQCKRQFYAGQFMPFTGLAPLLMDCGHIICESCSKSYPTKPCSICNMMAEYEDEKKTLPLHLYAMGVMVVSQNRPFQTDDIDIDFHPTINSKIRMQSACGLCQECGIQATIKCGQCCALFCFACYNRIHGRALQNHTKIILQEAIDDNAFIVRNTCSVTCRELMGYYCIECEIPSCSDCIINLHSKHSYIKLQVKNDELLPDFFKICETVTENLMRMRSAQKKLNSLQQTGSNKLNSNQNTEMLISQHFARLHGVLQNIEKRFVTKLYEQENFAKTNIKDICTQLKKQEDQLASALMLMNTIHDNLDKVDLQEIIDRLQKLAELPCHLVKDMSLADTQTEFNVDKTIIASLEKHCSLQMPTVSGFSLQCEELLPDGYAIEPLTQEISMPRFYDGSLQQKETAAAGVMNVPGGWRRRSTNSIFSVGSWDSVKITHIINPSHFYVQKVSYHAQLKVLATDLSKLANNSHAIPLEVTINKCYIVHNSVNQRWYRARISAIKITTTGQRYSVFFLDYGTIEENVPLRRIKNISPQFATIPAMAIRCSVTEIVPNKGIWDSHAIDSFKKLVTEDSLVHMNIVTIQGDIHYVHLYTFPTTKYAASCIAETLVFMKHATWVSSNKLMRMNNSQMPRSFFVETFEKDKQTSAEYLFIESPTCIYVQKKRANRTHFSKMIQDMNREYRLEEGPGFIQIPEKDLLCGVRGLDNNWYRGVICDEPTENTVRVYFVDEGYTLTVNYDSIRALSTKYMTCTAQAVRVAIKNIQPFPSVNGMWSKEATEYTKKHLENATQIEICGSDKMKDNAHLVNMYVNGANLAENLTTAGFAVYIKSWTNKKYKKKLRHKDNVTSQLKESIKPNLPNTPDDLNTSDNVQDPFRVCVVVHHAHCPDSIYVSYLNSEKTYDQLMKKMQDFYNTYRSILDNDMFKKNSVCVAYIAKDKSFYRVRIVDIKSPKEVIVFFYDTGMIETVSMEDIQALHENFRNVPAYVFKIKLAGILPCGGSTAWPSLSCEELRAIIDKNQKFYITKLEKHVEDEENVADDEAVDDDAEDDDDLMSVELWVKETKMDGPLTPTRIEMNSVNRMLVEKGVALPIKDYAKQRDKIMADELKRQLLTRSELMSKFEVDVKWLKFGNKLKEDGVYEINEEKTETTLPKFLNQSLENKMVTEYEKTSAMSIPPKLSSWISPNPLSEKSFIGFPTYLDHDGFLYLHSKKENGPTLQYIEKKLEEIYNGLKTEPCDLVWNLGDMCIAQYHANKKWYRAKVLQVQENDIIQVEFIDYGNVEECEIGTVRKKVFLGHIPIQCTKCRINKLFPKEGNGKWEISDLDRIHAHIIENECLVTVLDTTQTPILVSITVLPNHNVYNVECDLVKFLKCILKMNIASDGEESDNDTSSLNDDDTVTDSVDAIIENSYSVYETNDAVISGQSMLFYPIKSIMNSDDIKNKPEDVDNMSWQEMDHLVSSTPQVASQENLAMEYKTLQIPNEVEYIEVELCSSTNYYIQYYGHLKENGHSKFLNSQYNDYELLMNDMQKYASMQPLLENINPNMPCCVKYVDNIWYRCLILDINEIKGNTADIEVKLVYVDFGNDEYKTINPQKHDLRLLKPEWFDLPATSVKCQLWNIELITEVSEEHKTRLEEIIGLMFNNKPLIAKIKNTSDEFIMVELYEDKESKEVFYSSLIKEGIFKMITKEES